MVYNSLGIKGLEKTKIIKSNHPLSTTSPQLNNVPKHTYIINIYTNIHKNFACFRECHVLLDLSSNIYLPPCLHSKTQNN